MPWLILGALAVAVILALATLTFQLLDSPSVAPSSQPTRAVSTASPKTV